MTPNSKMMIWKELKMKSLSVSRTLLRNRREDGCRKCWMIRATGATGRGLEIVRRRQDEQEEARPAPRTRSRSRSHDAEVPRERTAFIAESFAIPLGANKNVREHLQGKNLKYDRRDADTEAGLDNSRQKEWSKWMDFNVGVILDVEIRQQLLDEGNQQLPIQ